MITNGDQSTDANFVEKKTGLAQGEKLYIAALSLDNSGNYGALVVEEVYSGTYPFNDIEVTIGEVSHSSDGKTVYVPVTTKGGEVVGYAIETATKNGFSGLVRLMVGFDTKGTILNVNVLEQNETPGLGAKMTEEGNPLLASIKGKEAGKTNLTVKKDGGDVDALTAATISSRAYTEVVAAAYEAFKMVNK